MKKKNKKILIICSIVAIVLIIAIILAAYFVCIRKDVDGLTTWDKMTMSKEEVDIYKEFKTIDQGLRNPEATTEEENALQTEPTTFLAYYQNVYEVRKNEKDGKQVILIDGEIKAKDGTAKRRIIAFVNGKLQSAVFSEDEISEVVNSSTTNIETTNPFEKTGQEWGKAIVKKALQDISSEVQGLWDSGTTYSNVDYAKVMSKLK